MPLFLAVCLSDSRQVSSQRAPILPRMRNIWSGRYGKPNHRLLYRDGVPIATGANGQMALLESIDPDEEWRVRTMLLREQRPSAFHRSPRRSV